VDAYVTSKGFAVGASIVILLQNGAKLYDQMRLSIAYLKGQYINIFPKSK
jgi:hypothetical protein